MTRRHVLVGLLITPWIGWFRGRDEITVQQRAFLEAYSAQGSIFAAARAVKIKRDLHFQWLTSSQYRREFIMRREAFIDMLRRRILMHWRNAYRTPEQRRYYETLLLSYRKTTEKDE